MFRGGDNGQGLPDPLLSLRVRRPRASGVCKTGSSCDPGCRRTLSRPWAAQTYEEGLNQRTVLIEFDSVEQAIAAHDSPGYQTALRALGSAAKRDVRIVEGLA